MVGDEGVMAQQGEERVVVRFAECAAAVRTPGGGLDLVSLRGDVVSVDPGDLRDGEAAVTAIERALPPGLFVPLEPRALADHVRAWPLEALGAVRVRTNPLYPCVELRVGDERVRLTFLTPRRAREAARAIDDARRALTTPPA